MSTIKTHRPSVLLIYTGGTIGMRENAETGALENFNFNLILDEVPELKRFDYKIHAFTFDPPIDSSDMGLEHWGSLVKIIESNYNLFDGFVILHGTDTMAYTASALSFMLENLGKPVILTGSQLPIGTLRTDGKENLITASTVHYRPGNSHFVTIRIGRNGDVTFSGRYELGISHPTIKRFVPVVSVGARCKKPSAYGNSRKGI